MICQECREFVLAHPSPMDCSRAEAAAYARHIFDCPDCSKWSHNHPALVKLITQEDKEKFQQFLQKTLEDSECLDNLKKRATFRFSIPGDEIK